MKTIICISILLVSIFWSNYSRFIIYGSSWDKGALLLSTQHSRWTKVWKKNTIHNAARSPDLVGLYKTMRGTELQNRILKEEGCTVLTRALTRNNGKLWERKKHWQKLDFPSQCNPAGYYVCGMLIKKQGGKKKEHELISETAYSWQHWIHRSPMAKDLENYNMCAACIR